MTPEEREELLKKFAKWIVDNHPRDVFGYCDECFGDSLHNEHRGNCIVIDAQEVVNE